MRRLLSKLKPFFWPGPDKPVFVRLLPYIVLVLIGLVVIAGGVAGWTYTNSVSFCGTSCHTMPPEFETYLRSPHARVDCVECHLGRANITVQLPRKVAHAKLVYATIFHTYELPIESREMRPATEACETCHYPEQFSNDMLKEVKYHLDDASNTPMSIFLTLKIGGGTKRQGLGLGIHWHVENKVSFYSTDPENQQIPYIRVEDENGNVTEYFDITSGLTTDSIKGKHLHTMDCIDCHNRVTHTIPNPEQAVDAALYSGTISSKVPNIRQKAVAIFSTSYADINSGLSAIDKLANDYHDNSPEVYSEFYNEIVQAIQELRVIYQNTNFPDQKLDLTTHPDNIGHKDVPGCFRCHDGKHMTTDGKAIRLECNLCHNIPVVADSTQFVTNIPIIRGPEPASHFNTSWISLHNKAIDVTCARCHPQKDPSLDYTKLNGQKPPMDGSFCGNSACHGSQWKYIGFDAPALQPILQQQLSTLPTAMPTAVPTQAPAAGSTQEATQPAQPALTPTYEGAMKSIFDQRCTSCHSGSQAMANLDLSSYAGILQGNKDGAGIVANNLDTSLVYTIQNACVHFAQMTADELALLQAWILGCAPEK